MEKWHVVALLLIGLGLLVIAVLLRARYGAKYELKTIDLVLIIIPLLFVLLVTGKVKVLDAFGVKADFSELLADAAGANIKQQVVGTSSPDVDEVVHMLEMAAKGGVQERCKERRSTDSFHGVCRGIWPAVAYAERRGQHRGAVRDFLKKP